MPSTQLNPSSSGRPASSHGEKGWMNRVLEENPVPAVWITNDADSMDPAFLRRFLLPVAFTTPPRAVRRRMVGRHLGDTALPEAFLDELAADDRLAPAQFGAARRLLDLQPGSDAYADVSLGLLLAQVSADHLGEVGEVHRAAFQLLAADP